MSIKNNINYDPVKKLENELNELRSILYASSSTPENTIYKNNEKYSLELLVEYAKLTQETVRFLIKSNVELQSKLAELIVTQNELIKEISQLINIFKIAAENVQEESSNTQSADIKEISSKLDKLIETNSTVLKTLKNIESKLDKLSTKDNLREISKPPIVPPSINVPFPPAPPILPPKKK